MPNSYLPPHRQEGHGGVILMGDSMNMRHPLTGGGMTVALLDVEIISNLLGDLDDFEDWNAIEERLAIWHQQRKSTSTCINVLAQALYSLFGAEGKIISSNSHYQSQSRTNDIHNLFFFFC
jgi:squalene monooxygenase